MRRFGTVLALAAVCVFSVSSANANLVSVAGPLSSLGVPAAITPAPAFALDLMVTNLAQQGFDERQGVIAPAGGILMDSGVIPAGTLVNSHMIFLNSPEGGITHSPVTWTFANPIIGVMSDSTGALEVATSSFLGAVGTAYPGAPFAARGMEGADIYAVAANTITVGMFVSQPGDWIRVITAAVPVPGAAVLGMMGMAMIGWTRRRLA